MVPWSKHVLVSKGMIIPHHYFFICKESLVVGWSYRVIPHMPWNMTASKVRGSPRPEDSRAKQRRVPSQSSGAYGKKYRAMREAQQSTEIKTYHFRE